MIGTEVQKAIHDALKASPAVAGGRVYDSVPSNAEFPYVTIGGEQTVDDGNSCEDGWEVFTDVHVWSRKPGFPECKEIAVQVRQRLAGITSISGLSLIAVEVEGSRFLRDPDGLTSHGIVSARFVLTPA